MKNRLIDEIDDLDWEDKHYERRKGDLDKRLDQTYDRIDELGNELTKDQERKDVILIDQWMSSFIIGNKWILQTMSAK